MGKVGFLTASDAEIWAFSFRPLFRHTVKQRVYGRTTSPLPTGVRFFFWGEEVGGKAVTLLNPCFVPYSGWGIYCHPPTLRKGWFLLFLWCLLQHLTVLTKYSELIIASIISRYSYKENGSRRETHVDLLSQNQWLLSLVTHILKLEQNQWYT